MFEEALVLMNNIRIFYLRSRVDYFFLLTNRVDLFMRCLFKKPCLCIYQLTFLFVNEGGVEESARLSRLERRNRRALSFRSFAFQLIVVVYGGGI